MIKYPIGIQDFEKIRADGWKYVDKTALVYQLVKTSAICFLSRPRRFGKSLLVSTLECYFKAKKELFQGLAMEKLEQDWVTYPVFKIDFNGGNYSNPNVLQQKLATYIGNWEDVYGANPHEVNIEDRFMGVLKRANEQTGHRAVVLIDEYDKPILDVIDSPMEDENRNTLKAFYSTFKSADAYLQFVLLTGVTKFSQVSVFSGFNQPKDISMAPDYEALCGITQEELEDNFAESIAKIADDNGCDVATMKEILQRQYDGYHFGRKMTGIYNPFSLLNAFDNSNIYDYWYASGTPTYLVKLLKHSNEQLNEITGKWYEPQLFIDYKADIEKPLPMIYQSGYLTIKEYDREMNEYLLDFPNNEVRNGFLSMIANEYFNTNPADVSTWISSSIRLLKNGNADKFRDAFTSFLSSIPYDAHDSIKDAETTEKHFQYTFYLILRLIGGGDCRILNENVQAKGRVDCILEFPDYVYIFEFKLYGNAGDALQQIEDKGYARPYITDKRQTIKIGVNFSSKERTIKDWLYGSAN